MLVPSVAPATTTAPSETVLLTQPEMIDRKNTMARQRSLVLLMSG